MSEIKETDKYQKWVSGFHNKMLICVFENVITLHSFLLLLQLSSFFPVLIQNNLLLWCFILQKQWLVYKYPKDLTKHHIP